MKCKIFMKFHPTTRYTAATTATRLYCTHNASAATTTSMPSSVPRCMCTGMYPGLLPSNAQFNATASTTTPILPSATTDGYVRTSMYSTKLRTSLSSCMLFSASTTSTTATAMPTDLCATLLHDLSKRVLQE